MNTALVSTFILLSTILTPVAHGLDFFQLEGVYAGAQNTKLKEVKSSVQGSGFGVSYGVRGKGMFTGLNYSKRSLTGNILHDSITAAVTSNLSTLSLNFGAVVNNFFYLSIGPGYTSSKISIEEKFTAAAESEVYRQYEFSESLSSLSLHATAGITLRYGRSFSMEIGYKYASYKANWKEHSLNLGLTFYIRNSLFGSLPGAKGK